MRTTAPRPLRRVCTVATITLLATGMGVFGSTAAFADTDPAAMPSTTATDAATTSASDAAAGDAAASDATTASASVTPTDGESTAAPEPADDPSPTSSTTAAAPAPASAPTDESTVRAAAATAAGQVSLRGTAGVGETLSATTNLWPAGTTFTYQWLRGTTPIVGATQSTYVLAQADVGSTVALRVVGTAPGDDPSTPVTSDPTATVGIAPSYDDDTVEVDLVAGESYSHFFDAGGTPTPRYQVFRADPNIEPDLPAGLTFSNGTVSGTPTEAGYFEFQVAADSTAGQDQIEVDMYVSAADAVGVGAFFVANGDDDGADFFQSDGTHSGTQTATVGQRLDILPYLYDRFGNFGASDPSDQYALSITSSVGSDVITRGAEDTAEASVTFAEAGAHVVPVSYGGFAVAVPVQVGAVVVAPVAAALPPSAPVTAAAPRSTTGSLASTGSDDAGLLAWALGLVAAGAAVTVLRTRRRRTQR